MAVVSMNDKEFARLDVILNLEAGRIRTADACTLLGLQQRQVFRLLRGFRERGAVSLVSSRRGRPSNNRLPEAVRELAIAIVRVGMFEKAMPTSARRSRPRCCASAMV